METGRRLGVGGVDGVDQGGQLVVAEAFEEGVSGRFDATASDAAAADLLLLTPQPLDEGVASRAKHEHMNNEQPRAISSSFNQPN